MSEDKRISILAVDDEPHILKALTRLFFEFENVEIETAASGFEGLDILKSGSSFDIILSDFRMPGMNGLQFLRQAAEIAPKTRRILLTGQAPEKEILDGLSSGVVERHIAKPWDTEELIQSCCNPDLIHPLK